MAVLRLSCLNRDWGCTWKSLTDNRITTKKEAYFNTWPFNTTHKAKELRALKKSMAMILHIKTTRAANHKTTLENTAWNAVPRMLANKHALLATPSKDLATAKEGTDHGRRAQSL